MTSWIVMPVVNGLEMTTQAIADCLAQTGVDVRVLVVLQGADSELRKGLESWAQGESRLLVWSHDPPLPSLSATWNRALRYVWEVGGEECLVVNNDVRLARWTYETLRLASVGSGGNGEDALFVSAVGVREREFEHYVDTYAGSFSMDGKGGPDFSCFLISRACHAKYPFDERFIPAYCEDLDYHRRLMLGGDGARIFSVNLPYLHYASQTLVNSSTEARAAFAARVQGSRAYYAKKWGGAVNQERFTVPFGPDGFDGVTTPELQRRVQAGEHPLGSAFVDQVIANQDAKQSAMQQGTRVGSFEEQ